jgi:hypothetical protein
MACYPGACQFHNLAGRHGDPMRVFNHAAEASLEMILGVGAEVIENDLGI